MFADATLNVNLDALAANYRALQTYADKSECAAVVKANAYGLGIKPIAQALWDAGARRFFVATVDEGMEVRDLLPGALVYIFHGFRKGQEKDLSECRLIPVLNSREQIALWQAHAQTVGRMPAVLHFDTGMNRLGLNVSEVEKLAENQLALDGLDIQCVMSHFACASQPEHDLNEEQYNRFNRLRRMFPETNASMANSAAALLKTCYHFDLIRPGIALYGSNPLGENAPVKMKPVVTLKANVLQVRTVERAGGVGYGATHEARQGEKLATLGLGYADGYLRCLGNVAKGYLNGTETPVVGRVSMDLIIVDVSAVPEAVLKVGAEVELLGERCTIDTLAKQANTIPYEILTRLGHRLKRVYTKEQAAAA